MPEETPEEEILPITPEVKETPEGLFYVDIPFDPIRKIDKLINNNLIGSDITGDSLTISAINGSTYVPYTGCLDVLSATPSYAGDLGETVVVSGDTVQICSYLGNNWRCTNLEATASSANYIFIDDFEAYTTGALNGIGYWDDDTNENFQIQTTTAYEGTKALRSQVATGQNTISKDGFNEVTDGGISIYMNISGTTNEARCLVGDAGTNILMHLDGNGGVMGYWDGAKFVHPFSGIANSTWYQVQCQWRSSDKLARFKCGASAWTDWVAGTYGTWTAMDTIRLTQMQDADAGAYSYYDKISFLTD